MSEPTRDPNRVDTLGCLLAVVFVLSCVLTTYGVARFVWALLIQGRLDHIDQIIVGFVCGILSLYAIGTRETETD